MSSSAHLTAGSEPVTQVSEREMCSFSVNGSDFTSNECQNFDEPHSGNEPGLPISSTVDWPFQRDWPVLGPLLFLIAASAVIRWTAADLRIAELFFDREHGAWSLERVEPWRSIYRQGPILAFILGIGAAVVAVLGRWLLPHSGWRRSRSLRRAAFFLALLLAIGPGLVINVGLKQLWGRPRPIHCVEFGGDKPFIPVGILALRPLKNSSFPSGHAAVAFYLMAPGFVVSRRRPCWTAGLFLAGTLFGFAMGAIRIVQGAHFLTDVLWSGALVYFVGIVLAKLILRNDECGECSSMRVSTSALSQFDLGGRHARQSVE